MADPKKKPPFDPTQPFEVVGESKPPFDPNQPYEVPKEALAAAAAEKPLPVGIPGAPNPDPPEAAYYRMSPEERGRRGRILAEYGIPAVAGAALGPEVVWPTRAAMMGLMGLATHYLGEQLDPSKTKDEETRRLLQNTIGTQLGEAGGQKMVDAAGVAGRALGPLAERQGLRALGFLSDKLSRLGSTGLEALERGQKVARIALDNDVLRAFTTSRGMAQRATDLMHEKGLGLAAARQAVDTSSPGVDSMRILNELIQRLQNWRPGRSAEPVLQGQLDDVVADLAAHANPQGRLGMQDLSDLKDVYGEGAHFHSTPESMATSRGAPMAQRYRDARGVAQGFEEAHAASNMTPEDFDAFMRDKGVFGAMKDLVGGHGALGKQVVKDASLNQIGLLPTIAAAGQPDPASALVTLVATRGLRQYGNQFAAVLADRVSKGLLDPGAARAIFAASQGLTRAAGPSLMEGLGLAPQEEQAAQP